MKFLTLRIELLFTFLWILKTKSEPDWTFDIIDINCTNQTPDLFNVNLYLKRIARGRFVLEGTISVGVDLTDETQFYSDMFYSPMHQHYVRTPFQIPKMSLSNFFNTFYKDLYLEQIKDCTTNSPLNDRSETFIPPWRKGVMVWENCDPKNDDAPSHLRSGYYKIRFVFTNQVETVITVLIKVEPK